MATRNQNNYQDYQHNTQNQGRMQTRQNSNYKNQDEHAFTSAPTTNTGPSGGITNRVDPGSPADNDPTNNQQKHKIVAVNKINNVIAKVKLDNGQILDKQEAVQMALDNKIWGVAVGTTRGEPREHYLRSVPLAGRENFLNNLPTFQMEGDFDNPPNNQ